MADREVVITHLDDLRLFADLTVHPVVSPDNWDVYSSLCDYIDNIKTEVEILLKEQEAVKIKVKKITESGRCGRCPNCSNELNETDYPNYCGFCGRSVKWNDT